jgi:hypothetical protein
VHVTLPDIVATGGVTVNETDVLYQLFAPLGVPGDKVIVGAAGPVASIFTKAVAGLLVPPRLSVAVQLTLWPELAPVTFTVALALEVPRPVTPLNVTGEESTVQLIDEIVASAAAVALTVPEAGEVLNQPLFPFGENESITFGSE